MGDGGEHVAWKLDEVLGADLVLVSGPGVEVGVGDVEHKGEGSGDKQHEHGAWNGLDEFVFDEETAKEER